MSLCWKPNPPMKRLRPVLCFCHHAETFDIFRLAFHAKIQILFKNAKKWGGNGHPAPPPQILRPWCVPIQRHLSVRMQRHLWDSHLATSIGKTSSDIYWPQAIRQHAAATCTLVKTLSISMDDISEISENGLQVGTHMVQKSGLVRKKTRCVNNITVFL